MKGFSLIVVMLCLFSVVTAQQAVKQKVAVYVTGDAENGYKKVIGSKLVTGITKSNNYIAVERTADFLAELAKEQDYQVSGAVSDKQIARLGQQFGVRYVLVADVSEVFESIFISARMINVQTAQITNSTEGSAIVDNVESLIGLSENIVQNLLYVAEFSEDAIKITGPFSTAKELFFHLRDDAPSGYRMANREEIGKILKETRVLNKKQNVPIYTDIERDMVSDYQYCDIPYVGKRRYAIYKISTQIIYENGSSQRLNFSFIDDDEPYFYLLKNYGSVSGLRNLTSIPAITSGYVYWIKN